MSQGLHFVAADLGAESGRVMLGCFDGDRLGLSEVHRFDSHTVRLPDGLHTNVVQMLDEVQAGLAAAARRADGEVSGVAVDTWGVDFALLDDAGRLLGLPYQYRDSLSDGMLDEALRLVPRAEIFRRTGIGFLPINTLYQLLGLKQRGAVALEAAQRLLMMPDLLAYWLSGRQANEYTIATTSQCVDARTRHWAFPLLDALGLPRRPFGEIVPPGTIVGTLLPHVASDAGLPSNTPVIAAGGHDTALAVAAVPARGRDFAYLSSGTWSLLGAELDEPCIGEASLAAGFTNEGGVAGSYRFLKNICGLWIVQECRRTWAKGGRLDSYDELTAAAAEAPAFRAVVDVNAPDFAKPGDMPARLQDYCRRSGQPVPMGKREIVRCVLDSLALGYRLVIDQVDQILGRRLEPLHIVGGGARNALLCQLAADATGRQVVAGPAEATAAGNVLMQAMAVGELSSLAQLREVVRRSFDVSTYEPGRPAGLDEACDRLRRLAGL